MRTKKSISNRIITSFVVIGIALVGLIIFVFSTSILTMNNLTKLNDYAKMNDFVIDSASPFSEARVNARIMMITDDYAESVYNDALSNMEEASLIYSNFKKAADKYHLPALMSEIDNAINGYLNYENKIKELNVISRTKLAKANEWLEQGTVCMTAFADLSYAVTNEILASTASMSSRDFANAFSSRDAVDQMRAIFTTLRIDSRTMLTNDTSVYQGMLDNIDKLVSLLSDYERTAPSAVLTTVRSLPDELGKYRDITVQYYEMIQQNNACAEAAMNINSEVQTIISALNTETTRVIGEVASSSTNQQVIVLVVLIVLSVLLIGFIIMYAVIMIRSISAALKSAALSLQQATENINSAAGELTSAAVSLAESGSEQAASIEETSATMNETASMVRQNTDNTRYATELAEQAGTIAMEAVRNSEELIKGMNKLSKSSDEINDIVSTITSISFQTNILALNASVEAVRAGDAGRSFAVVAGEVRNLSQQSSEASNNTETIIKNNINLTKQNVENSKQVSKTLEEISESTKRITRLLSEIFNASEEQTRGVQQINIALSQLEKVTQSNAAISEESAAAANELKSQADNLFEIYKIIDQLVYGSK